MFTQNYIKMCEKAEEIQKIKTEGLNDRGLKNKDLVAYDCGDGLRIYNCSEISCFWDIREKLIWLPTQEQLQGMVNHHYLTGFIYDLYEFSKEYLYMNNGNDLRFTSMNELWLAFVMYEKYHKIWNRKDWIKEVN